MRDTLELSETAAKTPPPAPTAPEAPPPPPPSVKWRIRIGEQEYGPYPRTRLLDFLKEGRVSASTLLACGADTDFHRADQHPQLRWDFTAPRKRRFGEPRLEPGETELPVCNYFIAARLLAGSEAFERVLRDAGKYARAGGDMWVLRSKQTVQQIRQRLSTVMRPNEQVVIVNATKDRLAWFNLGPDNDVAVRDVWDSTEVD